MTGPDPFPLNTLPPISTRSGHTALGGGPAHNLPFSTDRTSLVVFLLLLGTPHRVFAFKLPNHSPPPQTMPSMPSAAIHALAFSSGGRAGRADLLGEPSLVARGPVPGARAGVGVEDDVGAGVGPVAVVEVAGVAGAPDGGDVADGEVGEACGARAGHVHRDAADARADAGAGGGGDGVADTVGGGGELDGDGGGGGDE
ncbi:MAG: hypothetical protein Q9206_005381 [Seirophora lacunosa]